MRAALVASCLRGALPPVDLRAVCLVRAIVVVGDNNAVHRHSHKTNSSVVLHNPTRVRNITIVPRLFSLKLDRVSCPVPPGICFVTNDIVSLYHSQLRLFGSGEAGRKSDSLRRDAHVVPTRSIIDASQFFFVLFHALVDPL